MKKILVLVLALPLFGFNCTGPVDDNNGQIDQCLDCDGDHYCGSPTAEAIAADICEPTPDCNDRAPGINPGMPELCANGLDDNCNGQIDEECDECTDDREGSACSVGAGACTRIGQWLCPSDEQTAVCNAVAGTPVTEVCNNGLDDDCDGSVDEGCVIECTDPRIGQQCSNGIGVCQRSGVWQCTNNNVSCNAQPGTPVTEICGNGLDDDCDGQTDEGCPTGTTWYRDADGDTFGCQTSVSASCQTTVSVTQPAGYVANSTDCNDAVFSATNNCTGTTWYRDADNDGFGCQTSVAASCQTQVSVTQPSGYVANSTDCNDAAYSATNTCVPACLPLDGGDLRVELASNVINACSNAVIIVWGPGGSEHRASVGSSFFQQFVTSAWVGYQRVQILCNPENPALAAQAGYWNGQIFNWSSIGSKPVGVTVTFRAAGTANFVELADQKVISGPMSQSWFPACVAP